MGTAWGMVSNHRSRVSPGFRVTVSGSRELRQDGTWEDNAACGSMDPELFTVSRRGDRDLSNGQGQAIREHNIAKLQKAQAVCSTCPVQAECLADAEDTDLFWTVRGGQWPTSMRRPGQKNKKRVPSVGLPPAKPYLEDDSPCPSGHVGFWKTRADRPGKYCTECSKVAGKAFRKRRADIAAGIIAV